MITLDDLIPCLSKFSSLADQASIVLAAIATRTTGMYSRLHFNVGSYSWICASHAALQVLKTTVSLDDPSMPGWSELANDIVVNEKTVRVSHASSALLVQPLLGLARPTNMLRACTRTSVCQGRSGLKAPGAMSFQVICVVATNSLLGTCPGCRGDSHPCAHTGFALYHIHVLRCCLPCS